MLIKHITLYSAQNIRFSSPQVLSEEKDAQTVVQTCRSMESIVFPHSTSTNDDYNKIHTVACLYP